MTNTQPTLVLTLILFAIITSITIGLVASNYSNNETARVAIKAGYCPKIINNQTVWEKCGEPRK